MLSTEYLWGSTHILMPLSSSCFSLSCFLENNTSGRDLWRWGQNRWWTGRCQTHLGGSETVSFWYNIWFFVQKKSLLWSYTDWSWKSRLSTTFLRSETVTGWVKKGIWALLSGTYPLLVHSASLGAGHGGWVVEVAPGFLRLGNVGWFIIRLPLFKNTSNCWGSSSLLPGQQPTESNV